MQNGEKKIKKEVDDHYLGNIWGWKFSFISLILIVALGLLYFLNAQNQESENFDPVISDTIQMEQK